MGRIKAICRKLGIRAFIFLLYLFLGAGIFLGIEKTDDYKNQSQKYDKSKKDLMDKYKINMTDMAAFLDATKVAVKAGLFKSKEIIEWNFVNAFFFCGNVVTTIGYGHIAPKTDAGRIVCILYALFGIPLTGYFLRTVGNELTNGLAHSIKYWERKLYNREAEKIEMKSAITASLLALLMLFLGGGIFTGSEKNWNYLDSFYFCFISLTTIGFGDLVPGLNKDGVANTGVSLVVELAALIYYVIGLSVMSGVILSISNLIEEKTKKFDVTDPMDAIRNLRIENLNTKAMKKLGYKVTNGPLDEMTHYNLNTRRGTIVPEEKIPRRVSKLFDEAQRNRLTTVGIPHMMPNGTTKRKVQPKSSEPEGDGANKIADENGDEKLMRDIEQCYPDNQGGWDNDATEVDADDSTNKAATASAGNGLTVGNSVIVDVDVSPAPSRRTSSTTTRPNSATTQFRSNKKISNKVIPVNDAKESADNQNNQQKTDITFCSKFSAKQTSTQPPPLTKKPSKTNFKPRRIEIGLPSEMFASSLHRKRRVLERASSDSHTDEVEYNEIVEEILQEHTNSKKSEKNRGARNNQSASPSPEFLSLTKTFSSDSGSESRENCTARRYSASEDPGSTC
eukprot:gene16949-18656_t